LSRSRPAPSSVRVRAVAARRGSTPSTPTDSSGIPSTPRLTPHIPRALGLVPLCGARPNIKAPPAPGRSSVYVVQGTLARHPLTPAALPAPAAGPSARAECVERVVHAARPRAVLSGALVRERLHLHAAVCEPIRRDQRVERAPSAALQRATTLRPRRAARGLPLWGNPCRTSAPDLVNAWPETSPTLRGTAGATRAAGALEGGGIACARRLVGLCAAQYGALARSWARSTAAFESP
jgi:hypothetical protein